MAVHTYSCVSTKKIVQKVIVITSQIAGGMK